TNLYMDHYGPKRLMGMEENPPITDVSPNHGGLPDWRWEAFLPVVGSMAPPRPSL
ncbi:UNVERIFIED_CONTAM: hypothetical protein Sindi_2876100, partial [Sesamum indicum]